MTLSSCAHDNRFPIARDTVKVQATAGSSFVVRCPNAAPSPYELRKSVNLAVTPHGRLTEDGCDFSPPVVLPLEERIHCRLSASGELSVSKGDGDWTVIAQSPVYRIADADRGPRPLSQSGYDRLISSGEYGSVEPVAFVVIRNSGGSFTIRAE